MTRTLVSAADAGFARPSKPIGRYLSREEAAPLVEHGEHFEERGPRGWRRMVASPEPLEILDAPAVQALVSAGYVVIAAGGGGIPVVREPDGSLRGIECVIDKDLAAAVLADAVAADLLVIATDVPYAMLDYDTPQARPIGRATLTEMRQYAAEGQFGGGSMGPKVEAVCRFVERAGKPGVITSLNAIGAGAGLEAGTVVVPDVDSEESSRA